MDRPEERQWVRVEELAAELGGLPPTDAARRVDSLRAQGESPTVLTLLGFWLALEPPPPPLTPGDVIAGRYELVDSIGDGGMGSVWRARQQLIGRDVALKIIHPALVTPEVRRRFIHEMEILGRLDQPGIVRIYDAGLHPSKTHGELPFYAMELVEGTRIDQWVRNHGRQPATVLPLVGAIAAALQRAHERHVVHRDLKPANILVRPDGSPVVLDFGIARLAGVAAGIENGQFSGTPVYASPEQHLGRDLDFGSGESSDIYSLGAVLFELLTGRRYIQPPPSAPAAEVRRLVLSDPLPTLTDVLPDCPAPLAELVSKCLEREPAERYLSMASLSRALDRVLSSLSRDGCPPPAWAPAEHATLPGSGWILESRLGSGGVGEVWSARHPETAERRIFKFCTDPAKVRTLRREASLYRLLRERIGQNPHFIQLLEISLDEPPWYLAMADADAFDLPAWAASFPGGIASIPLATRLEIASQVAEALQQAHDAGILHRDLKPSNVLIRTRVPPPTPNPDIPHVHALIADFGIGQVLSHELLAQGPRQGFTVTVTDIDRARLSGTMLYLAPEVLEGQPATVRSDIYSLGVLLWQLVTGRLNAALDPTDWQADVPDPLLREDIARCIAGQPSRRWNSAGELAASLRSLDARRHAEAARQAEITRREQRAFRLGVLRTATLGAVMLAVVTGLAIWAFRKREEALQRGSELALQQAAALRSTTPTATLRDEGLQLLRQAAGRSTNRPLIRSVAAAILDLPIVGTRVPDPVPGGPATPGWNVPPRPDETLRNESPDGRLLAIARDLDGLNGAVEIHRPGHTHPTSLITRAAFPWIPVAEPGLLEVSPDNRLVAIGGRATSRQIVIAHTTDGTVHSYLYHPIDPVSCTWHPASGHLAVGCTDGSIVIWELSAARRPRPEPVPAHSHFNLPPALDLPANDTPALALASHRYEVRHLGFSPDGNTLASLDRAGHAHFTTGFQGLSSTNPLPSVTPAVRLELRIPGAESVTAVRLTPDSLRLRMAGPQWQSIPLQLGPVLSQRRSGPSITTLAASRPDGSLCVVTPAGVEWLSPRTLTPFHALYGVRTEGFSWSASLDGWVGSRDADLFRIRIEPANGHWTNRHKGIAVLSGANANAGSVITHATDDAGRVAAYFGRILSFHPAPADAPAIPTVPLPDAEGVLAGVFWDQPGALVGIVRHLPSGGSTRVDLVRTATNGHPQPRLLAPFIGPQADIAPAQDARHLLVRDATHGVQRYDSDTGQRQPLDASEGARQPGPLIALPELGLAAYALDRGRIRLIHSGTGIEVAVLEYPGRALMSHLVWQPDSRILAAGTPDGRVLCWRLKAWVEWLEAHGLLP